MRGEGVIIKAHENAAFLPATDADGDRSCLTVTWEPTADELLWATHSAGHPEPIGDPGGYEKTAGAMRAAYLVYKASQAYSRSAHEAGYVAGWQE